MKKKFYILLVAFYSLLTTHHSHAQLVDKTPAAVPSRTIYLQ